MSGPDDLYTLRNLFWLGNFQAAITEANSLKRVNKTLVQSRDEFVYRSYIGLGQYDIVINEIADSSNVDFRSLKLLALYLQKRTSHVETMIQLDELQNEAAKTSKGTFYYVLAVMHVYGDSIKDALDATDSYNSVELTALAIQLLLRIDRLDLAFEKYTDLKKRDDGCLSQLAFAWLSMRSGGAKSSTEAVQIYDELIDKYGGSVSLLNGIAVSLMQAGNFQEADARLQEALNKDSSNPDTLANAIAVSFHLSKSQEVINRLVRYGTPSMTIVTSNDLTSQSTPLEVSESPHAQ